MSTRVLRWLIDTVWFLRRYRPVERSVIVTITADTSRLDEAMRDLLGWHHPANPYRHWPPCAYAHEINFEINPTGTCPSCKAAL